MATAQVAPTIRIGLVAYRDRGDAYVTRTFDLTEDLDGMYTELMRFQAAGGGDGPEGVNQALHEAVTTMSWTDDPNAYKVVFLVGDAPAHMDYDNDVRYPQTVREASRLGIVINTILCGTNRAAKRNWQKIAGLGQGQYFQVHQNGGAVAVATPYDKRMAKLSRELDQTRLSYGSRKERAAVEKKRSRVDAVMSESSVASAARRAAFNVSASGKSNLLRDKDLVADVTAGKVDVEALAPAQLPAALKGKSTEEVQAEVTERAEKRAKLEKQIKQLSDQRQAYIRDEIATRGKGESLDDKIFSTIRSQAAGKGLTYEADATRY
jgi:post-segregation antitoxin (ccd killing protein)